MANLGFNLDQKEAENFGSFTLVPPGWYAVVITKSEIKKTKNGDGQYIEITNEIQGGNNDGDPITDRINIVNQSEVAQRIGRSALAKIGLVIGHQGELTNTDVLHGRPYQIKVEVSSYTKADGSDGKSNNVKDYRENRDRNNQAPAPAKSTDW